MLHDICTGIQFCIDRNYQASSLALMIAQINKHSMNE